MNKTKNRNKRKRTFNNYRHESVQPTHSKQLPVKKKKLVSNLDPNKLVNKGGVSPAQANVPTVSFDEMPIHASLKANLKRKGFLNPTRIQIESMDYLTRGMDLIGIANTGTGKTGAFLIPIIEQMLQSKGSSTSLVVVPTRELALQVEMEFKSLTNNMGFEMGCFIGGTNINKDLQNLKKPRQMIIGTPGRLLDLHNRRALSLKDISILVLDEYDRMLDMGFVNDIKKIVQAMHSRRQTMLFSATVDPSQQSLIDSLVKNPAYVTVSQEGPSISQQIEQDIIRVAEGQDKFTLLIKLLDDREFEKVLIFAETKRWVDRVCKKLNKSGVQADQIHGNKSQSYRNNALNKFKNGSVRVLVATDVAARGIDVSDVTHVINYQMPMTYDSYTHRIGRTGRAGKTGKAFTFVG